MNKATKFLILFIFWIFAMSFILPARAGGTGFFISNDGYILTNHHVATQEHSDNQPTPQMILYNGRWYTAHFVYMNNSIDLALYKIDAVNTPCMPVVQEDIQMGQVLHIGTYDFRGGYVSLLESVYYLKVYKLNDPIFIQDVIGTRFSYALYPPYIRPGDSGSPVVDGYNRIVSVVWGSDKGSHRIYGYSLANDNLVTFIQQSNAPGCQRPINEVRDDIVWFQDA